MKKEILFSVLVLILCTYLQFGRQETVLFSRISATETTCAHDLYVNANKLFILNKENYERKLADKIVKNRIKGTRFSYDDYSLTEFNVSVYTNRFSYFLHKSFSFNIQTSSRGGYTSTPL